MPRNYLYVLALAFTFVAADASAISLPTIADTYTDQAAPTTNFGGNGVVAVAGGRVALLRFDPAKVAGSHGDLAILTVKVPLLKNWRDAVVLRLVEGPWNEATVTARTLPPLSSGVLDEKVIEHSEQGMTVIFDVSSALARWRSAPGTNFGVAIVPGSPLPNIQLGSREAHTGATLDIGDAVLFQVTSLHDGRGQLAGAINNLGEIIYHDLSFTDIHDRSPHLIVSTRRGELVTNGGPNLRSIDLNDAGEVAYVDVAGTSGLLAISSTRGILGRATSVRIGQDGQVAAANAGEQHYPLAIFGTNGSLTPVTLDADAVLPPAASREPVPLRLSDFFGLAYLAIDHDGLFQIFSSMQGQLSHFSTFIDSIAMNDLGEYVYNDVIFDPRTGAITRLVRASDGRVLLRGDAGAASLNNAGDIALTEFLVVNHIGTSRVLLLTRHPLSYRQERFVYRETVEQK